MLAVETWWGETWIADRGAELPATVRGGTDTVDRVALLGVDLGRVAPWVAAIARCVPFVVDVTTEPACLAAVGLDRELATIDAAGWVTVARVPGWRCPAGNRFRLAEGEAVTLHGPGVAVRLRRDGPVRREVARFVVAPREARSAA
jgi:hypothetical protein